jgi:hypothetical protein
MFSQRGKLSLTECFEYHNKFISRINQTTTRTTLYQKPVLISTLDHVKFHFRGSFTCMRKGIAGNEEYAFNEVQVARWGARWRSRKVAGSIPDGVTGIYY